MNGPQWLMVKMNLTGIEGPFARRDILMTSISCNPLLSTSISSRSEQHVFFKSCKLRCTFMSTLSVTPTDKSENTVFS
ncbi:hypothetical protein L596_021124 [Steinernema carpocapsae]|uniref:Uncharacterized protein n=1 Tax=Steinernema carpocapsae TaxID=34508 RepID=A0A4U5MVM0_STECR|nr:hypothetical protein L596_021124 [Steinernema carpocapsae]